MYQNIKIQNAIHKINTTITVLINDGCAIGSDQNLLFLRYTYIKGLSILENYVKSNICLGDQNQDPNG